MQDERFDTHRRKTGRTRFRRFSLVAIPASAITASLFLAMHSAVEVDDFSPPEMIAYKLVTFKPKIIETPKLPRERDVPPPDPVKPPPNAPPLVKDIKLVNVPTGGYSGVTPADYGEADLDAIKPARKTSVIDRSILPISAPVPSYSPRAKRQGLEGDCLVRLSVSTRGEPFNVQADCTDQVFENAARKAVLKVKFAPQIHAGLPVTVTGVVYPLEFRMKP